MFESVTEKDKSETFFVIFFKGLFLKIRRGASTCIPSRCNFAEQPSQKSLQMRRKMLACLKFPFQMDWFVREAKSAFFINVL